MTADLKKIIIQIIKLTNKTMMLNIQMLCLLNRNYGDLSDYFVNLSGNYDDLLESDVDLKDDFVDLSDPYVDLSKI